MTGTPLPRNPFGLFFAQGVITQPDSAQPLGTRRLYYNGNSEHLEVKVHQ